MRKWLLSSNPKTRPVLKQEGPGYKVSNLKTKKNRKVRRTRRMMKTKEKTETITRKTYTRKTTAPKEDGGRNWKSSKFKTTNEHTIHFPQFIFLQLINFYELNF